MLSHIVIILSFYIYSIKCDELNDAVKETTNINSDQLDWNNNYQYVATLKSNTTLNSLKSTERELRNPFFQSSQRFKSTYLGRNSLNRKLKSRKGQQKSNDIEFKSNKLNENKESQNRSAEEVPIDIFGEVKYNVGPGVNISLDKPKEMVNVYLDEDCLKDVFTGRGKKFDLISKILPLFILPFLIQSAIIPFMVSALKLLLIKSIVVGKIAIFLLIVSALKNNHISSKSSYEPAYYVDPPSRRSESQTIGYRVDGKPTAWIN